MIKIRFSLSPQSLVLLLLLILAACVPAQTPPILLATAGAPVVMADNMITTSAFRAQVPVGWRAILSPADQPPFLTIARADNCALMLIAASAQAVPTLAESCGATQTITRTITRDQAQIMVIGHASSTNWQDFIRVFMATAGAVQDP